MKDVNIWMYLVIWFMWVVNCGISFYNEDMLQGNLFLIGFVLLGVGIAVMQKLNEIKENL